MRKSFLVGLFSGLFMLGSVLPMAANGFPSNTNSVFIGSNGYKSTNTVKITQLKTQVATRTNSLMSRVKLKLWGNTGDNEANKNTGGEVSIDTGDVSNLVDVTVSGGDNDISEEACGCEEEDGFMVKILKNGAKSNNDVEVTETETDVKTQLSSLMSSIKAKLGGNTGANQANKNTGSGADVSTGDVDNGVIISISGGDNDL